MKYAMNDTANVGTEEVSACTSKQFAAEYLREIANGRAPEHYGYGLCYNLSSAILDGYINVNSGYDIILKYAPLWPEFSGDAEYPVKCDMYEVDGQRTGYIRNDLWVGEYGAARRRLAGFISDCLEEELKA